jgi:hypothetical protein
MSEQKVIRKLVPVISEPPCRLDNALHNKMDKKRASGKYCR